MSDLHAAFVAYPLPCMCAAIVALVILAAALTGRNA